MVSKHSQVDVNAVNQMYKQQRSSGHAPACICASAGTHAQRVYRNSFPVYPSWVRQMETITQRVNVVLSSLIKGRESRQSVTNVFVGETEEKTFDLHLIKAL